MSAFSETPPLFDPAGGRAREPVRLARAGLLRACEPAAPGVAELVAACGAERAFEAVCARVLVPGVSDRWLSETEARTTGRSGAALRAMAEADLEAAARVGARLVVPEDLEWPEAAVHGLGAVGRLADRAAHPPLALYVRGGAIDGLPTTAVTVVGSRAATPYGRHVAGEIGHGLAAAGLTVVSGAAFGIDTAVHRSALAAGAVLPTAAVLACGIDQAYPVGNRALIERIAEAGAVVSEYPPGTHPSRIRFLVRNRLIAAFGVGTVVVEAGYRSGTLSTAAAAQRLHRLLMVVPGPVVSAMSVGCHRLLKEPGATLVTGTGDILDLLRPHLADLRDGDSENVDGDDDLGAPAKAVMDALSARTPQPVVELARETGMPAREVLEVLSLLDVSDLAQQTSGGWIRRTRRSGQGARR